MYIKKTLINRKKKIYFGGCTCCKYSLLFSVWLSVVYVLFCQCVLFVFLFYRGGIKGKVSKRETFGTLNEKRERGRHPQRGDRGRGSPDPQQKAKKSKKNDRI